MHISIHLPSQPTADPELLLHRLYAARDVAFFDEHLAGYVLVQQHPDLHVSISSHFEVFLDVSIIPGDILDTDPNYSPASFVVESLVVDELVASDLHDGLPFKLYRFSIPVKYPNKKLNSPRIHLSATIRFNDPPSNTSTIATLTDLEPCHPRNLLRELNLSSTNMFLSSTIIEDTDTSRKSLDSRVVADISHTDNSTAVASVTPATVSLPVLSALVVKLKSTKPAGKNNELLASFNVETSDHLAHLHHSSLHIRLNEFELSFAGQIININEGIYHFPIDFAVDESINLNFKLINNESLETSRQVTVTLNLQVLGPAASPYSSTISTSWSPLVDFNLVAPPISNSLKSMLTQAQPPQTLAKRRLVTTGASSLSTANTLSFKKTATNPVLFRKGSSNSSMTVNLCNPGISPSLFGLKLTFNGNLTVPLGQVTVWKLQAINNSSSNMMLSLVLQGQKDISASTPSVSQQPLRQRDLVPAYMKPALFSLYNSLKLDNNGVLLLDNDVRIGPLEPNSVFETNVKIIGLSRGVFNLDGLNIFDLASGDGLDFGKLVEVFVT
ncbi:hypothetical protein PSN45_003121 [Yamadazyma tenuis]|uniref:Trafficking protein particle complex II-specific subunit 65 IgD3 domain-containing protein n=1 Tax=Candida tenuis (strain ATCC 10573 / BCRC 21748 / CBS 615 / JCM 9827 / NBRC 10315 / NRRL Y-1498 / VKM Y-70) TaxID=590646 RepID=G3AZC0_CANTC|nr:uncharacterized protein CANTEDRAFT_133486 [Yamadazyma tenuis ATCC 10573]EGV66058.1 hypothetical protein CANTEDRAFT_133486 [Yamadazyma tenuis ATCC 10573]WEJ95598.1 hypothetical protein PSN45_003121 [Yamadazyma tenuis]